MAENELRRSLRLALMEVSINEPQETPEKSTSADEMVIIQRGPRCKPITWSPLEYFNDEFKTNEKTPPSKFENKRSSRNSIDSNVRRRLTMSPGKASLELGLAISKKLKQVPKLKNFE